MRSHSFTTWQPSLSLTILGGKHVATYFTGIAVRLQLQRPSWHLPDSQGSWWSWPWTSAHNLSVAGCAREGWSWMFAACCKLMSLENDKLKWWLRVVNHDVNNGSSQFIVIVTGCRCLYWVQWLQSIRLPTGPSWGHMVGTWYLKMMRFHEKQQLWQWLADDQIYRSHIWLYINCMCCTWDLGPFLH